MRTALLDAARLALRELVDAVFPPLCPLCRAAPEARDDALGCAAHALVVDPGHGPPGAHCRRCARPLGPALPDGALCARCRRGRIRVRRVVTLWDYARDAPVRDWVLALKHGGRRDLARPLGAALGARLAASGAAGHGDSGDSGGERPLLVPVPLHPLRRLERGHDQAAELARAAARAGGFAFLAALRRARWTPPQGAPGAASRRANVRGAFRVRRRAAGRLRGRHVVVVDDVVGSGATVDAAAEALRAAGCASVVALALARAADPPNDPPNDPPGDARGADRADGRG